MSRKATSAPPATKKKVVDPTKLEELFAQFADEEDPDVAYFEGIAKFCEMIGLDATSDIRTLVLLWKMEIPVVKPGQMTKTDFVNGMTKLNVGDISAVQNLIPSLDPGFLERQEFRDLYKFVFQFSREGTHKTLEKELVLGLMPMILDKDRAPHLSYFLEFLQSNKEARITLDQWESFLQFNHAVKEDLSNFEDDGAWPLLIDEYVEWRRKNKN